jgi:leader peptidase (prepilin peptidase)/N-methyltransferase
MNTPVPVLVWAGLMGLAVGSFLNVLIHRLPRGSSVVAGRSKCPHCKKSIRWFDNIPVLSYVILVGRCRQCRRGISPVYPVVELISAAIAVVVVLRFGLSLQALWIYLFLAAMLVITVIDWFHQIIPDVLSLGGVVLGWVGAVVCLDVSILDSFIGSLAGGGLVLAVALLYKAIRKEDGMGGGDVKLMAMIGAFMGWQMVFPVLFLASLLGSVYGVFLIARGATGRTAVAFGSFLAPSAGVLLWIGPRVWEWYLGW